MALRHAVLAALRTQLLAGHEETDCIGNTERIGPCLTLMGCRTLEQQNIHWIEAVAEILERRRARDGRA